MNVVGACFFQEDPLSPQGVLLYNTSMQIDIITLFPDMFAGPFNESIVKRACGKNLVKINFVNLRNFAIDKRGTVDDRPFGGGTGMILRVEPIFEAVASIKQKAISLNTKVVLTSASGKLYTQKKAFEYSKTDNLIVICGHYEGVDERVTEHLIDEEISIGDYVLTGGEIPAMVIVDSVTRLIPDVLEKPEAIIHESFSFAFQEDPLLSCKGSSYGKSLEYPQYTRPADYNDFKVPEILLNGNHKEIEKWRKEKSLEKTQKNRPDLFVSLSDFEEKN